MQPQTDGGEEQVPLALVDRVVQTLGQRQGLTWIAPWPERIGDEDGDDHRGSGYGSSTAQPRGSGQPHGERHREDHLLDRQACAQRGHPGPADPISSVEQQGQQREGEAERDVEGRGPQRGLGPERLE